MQYELNVRDYIVSSDEHKSRQEAHEKVARSLVKSIREFDPDNLSHFRCCVKQPFLIPLNSNPKWCNRPFGAVNTVQKAGSLAFVSKLLLDEFRFNYIDMDSIINEIEQKHYRLWRLANRDKTLTMPIISFKGLKSEFPNDEMINSCKTLDEIYSIAGNPIGIGGSMFFIDNLILCICSWLGISIDELKLKLKLYSDSAYDTRIYNVEGLIDNLEMGCPIPLRVNNSIYLNNPNLEGGHYITLYGFVNGTAIVVDSNIDSTAGVKRLPIEQLFRAMIANPSLTCAWNTSLALFRPTE